MRKWKKFPSLANIASLLSFTPLTPKTKEKTIIVDQPKKAKQVNISIER